MRSGQEAVRASVMDYTLIIIGYEQADGSTGANNRSRRNWEAC